jgi:hypothetical protein
MQVKMGKRVSETGSPGVIWSDFRPLQLREEAFHKAISIAIQRLNRSGDLRLGFGPRTSVLEFLNNLWGLGTE